MKTARMEDRVDIYLPDCRLIISVAVKSSVCVLSLNLTVCRNQTAAEHQDDQERQQFRHRVDAGSDGRMWKSAKVKPGYIKAQNRKLYRSLTLNYKARWSHGWWVWLGGGQHSGNSECGLPLKYPPLLDLVLLFLLNIGGGKLYNDIAFKKYYCEIEINIYLLSILFYYYLVLFIEFDLLKY